MDRELEGLELANEASSLIKGTKCVVCGRGFGSEADRLEDYTAIPRPIMKDGDIVGSVMYHRDCLPSDVPIRGEIRQRDPAQDRIKLEQLTRRKLAEGYTQEEVERIRKGV